MVRAGPMGLSMVAVALVAPSISGLSVWSRSATSVMDLLLVAGPARRRGRCSVEASGAARPLGAGGPGGHHRGPTYGTRGPAGLGYEEGSEPDVRSPRCLSDAGRGARSTTGIG